MTRTYQFVTGDDCQREITVGGRRVWRSFRALGLSFISAWLVLSACASDDAASKPETKALAIDLLTFPQDRLLQVSISVPEVSWNAMCLQGPDLVSRGCDVKYEYDWFAASLTVDGNASERATVRKKGTMGSLSTIRPALKVKFERDELLSTTLNNNRQDPSNVRQCVTYELFAKAGLPAPRCALARVLTNGRDLGIYTHVEPIKKAFLRREFGDETGNLYQGEFADFTASRQSFFQAETNEKSADGAELARVTAALQVDDEQLEQALSDVMDLDEFITYWAMEVLSGHWDGYSGNTNNFYVYSSPKDGLLHFIVYGADNSFVEKSWNSLPGQAISVWVKGALCSRIYSHPELKQRYVERLRDLLDKVWVEADLRESIERWAAIGNSPPTAVAPVIAFVEGRRAALLNELDTGSGSTAYPERVCRKADVLPSTGSIEVAWTDTGLPSGAAVVHELVVPFEGSNLAFVEGSVKGWVQADAVDPNLITLRLIGAQQGTGRVIGVGFELPRVEFTDGTHLFHGVESVGGVAELYPPELVQGPLVEVLGGGTFTLAGTASTVSGSVVAFSWSAQMVPWSKLPNAP